MANRLFICNTPYQLLIAAHMAENMFTGDITDVILSNHFSGTKEIAERINKEKLVFRHAYYVESFEFSRRKGKYQRTRLKNRVLYGINIKHELGNFIELIETYDEMYIANYECFTELVFNYIRRYMNSKIKVFSFEDGYGSLCDDWMIHVAEVEKSSARKWFDRRMLNLWYTPEVYAGYYVLKPDYLSFDVPCHVMKIKELPLKNLMFLDKINRIFGYKAEECDNYENKVILFEESAQAEGIEFSGDIETADGIADIVGEENIIVKRHPRNTKDRFAEAGYKTNKNTWIPWEVIILNQDVSNSIMIAIGCSSIITSHILKNINQKSIYLFRYVDNPVLKKCHKDFIKKIHDDYKIFYIPEDEEEMLKIVEKLKLEM